MTDTIHVLDGSRMLHRSVPLTAIAKLGNIRPVEVQIVPDPDNFLDEMVHELLDPRRNQVDHYRLIERINSATRLGKGQIGRDGKVIIIDEDLYSDKAKGWCFGGFQGTEGGLGYILLSAKRLYDDVLAEHAFRHELGHMFRAPRRGRDNTREYMGFHCTNHPCIMQQKDTVKKAQRYAHQLYREGAGYCEQCLKDIQAYRPL